MPFHLAERPYELQVQQPGFKPFKRTGLEVTSGAALRLRHRVDPGGAFGGSDSERIAGSGGDGEHPGIGGAISATKMTSIPINGRSYTDLLALQPGVIPASSQQPNVVGHQKT